MSYQDCGRFESRLDSDCNSGLIDMLEEYIVKTPSDTITSTIEDI